MYYRANWTSVEQCKCSRWSKSLIIVAARRGLKSQPWECIDSEQEYWQIFQVSQHKCVNEIDESTSYLPIFGSYHIMTLSGNTVFPGLQWDSSSYFVAHFYWRVDINSTQDNCPLFLTVLVTATVPRIPSNMQTSSERKLRDYSTLELPWREVSLANMLNYQIRSRHVWERRATVSRNTRPEYWVRKWTGPPWLCLRPSAQNFNVLPIIFDLRRQYEIHQQWPNGYDV